MLAPVRPLHAVAPTGAAPAPPYPLTPAFTAALAVYLCRDRAFWARIGSWVDPGAIAHPGCRLLVLACKTVATEMGHGPASVAHVLQRIRRWVDQGTHTAEEFRAATAVVEAFDAALDEGQDVPLPEAIEIELVPVLRARHQREALVEANLLVASGRSEEVPLVAPKLAAIATIGVETDDLGDGWEDAEAALESVRHLAHCPVGVDEVDAILNGGPHRGSYTLWGAGTGGSKSTSIVHAACTALLRGVDALIVTFETSKAEFWARVYANLSGVPIHLVREDTTAARREIERIRASLGNLRIVELPDGQHSIHDVRDIRRRLQDRLGHPFPWVGLDGIDHIIHRGWNARDGISELGRHVARDVDLYCRGKLHTGDDPVWLHATSHLQRGKKWTVTAADGTAVPGKDDFADSHHRAKKAHYALTNTVKVNQDTGERSIYIHLAKSRFSASEIVLGPLPTDLGTARLTLPFAPSVAPMGVLPFA